ncbi:MAG: NAD(+)/NADH kinase [Bacteroidales bacterium]
MLIAISGNKIDVLHKKKITYFLNNLHDRKNVELCYYEPLYSYFKKMNFNIPNGIVFKGNADLPSNTSLFLALGGDGTFLHSVSIIRDRNIPIAGINFGRLGFLTSIKIEENDDTWIDDLLNKNYDILSRSLIKIDYNNISEDIYPYALNEVSIQRTSPSVIGLEVTINDDVLPIYWADGILVATCAGSTAYSLSVGGPIVVPDSKVFILAPIAPHNLNVRPIVLPDTSNIKIKIISRSGDATLSMDNKTQKVKDGDIIHLSKSKNTLNCVNFSQNSFFHALNEKLLWGEDTRNKNN